MRRISLLAILLATSAVQADHLEELVVTASHDTRTIDITDEFSVAADVTELLKKAPGANVNSNGPLTGIPQYRGQYGARIAVSLDGNQIAPSGPNWMDPPLSYAVGGQLEALQLYRGIAPVGVAQESIGGAVEARTDRGSFSTEDALSLHGRVTGNARSVNEAYHVNTAVYAANRQHRLKLAAMTEEGDDAEFPDGDILPTEYERQRYDLGYGFRTGDHTLQLDYANNDTDDSGTPALPMDIETIDGDLYSLGYQFNREGVLRADLSLFANDLDHEMTNFLLREAPPPGMWRRNTAASDNLGFRAGASLPDAEGNWSFGIDGFSAEHDSDISNPNNPMFFVRNFNDAERDLLGVFLERQQEFNEYWRAELGIRYNRVEMDADAVDGTPAMMMTPATALRDAFNGADREQNDDNVDLVARAWYRASASSSWYLGVARKTRSPSYQERYLWLPLEATAGLADGNTYTGTIGLDPEVSHQVEGGLDFSNGTVSISPRLFYNEVDDYIQGVPSENAAAIALVRMMNNNNGTNNPDPLQFANVDARLYGFDMDWAWQITGAWSLSGLVNYVRGERDDSSDDDLYRIAPLNGTVQLSYTAPGWSARIEAVLYDDQDNVSETNNEQETSGYELVNLGATWQVTDQLQLAGGVENVFDEDYEDHLGGYNRAANPDIPRGSRLPGYGTNVLVRVTYEF
jgi:iron complex outermembrane receptor protein